MEKKILLKLFSSEYIFHFGSAYVIIFARHNDKGFNAEYYVLIERPDGSFNHISQRLNSSLTEKELGDIEEFITEICLRNIKSYITNIVFKSMEQSKSEIKVLSGEILLHEAKKSSIFLYLISKDRSQLEWVRSTTKSPELIDIIDFYMDLIIQFTAID